MGTKLDKIKYLIMKNGFSDSETDLILDELTAAGALKLELEMMSIFSDEDLKKIDEVPEAEAKLLIRKLFIQRSGKRPEEIMDLIMSDIVLTFLKENFPSERHV